MDTNAGINLADAAKATTRAITAFNTAFASRDPLIRAIEREMLMHFPDIDEQQLRAAALSASVRIRTNHRLI